MIKRSFLVIALISAMSLQVVAQESKWEGEFKAFEALDQETPPPKEGAILFTGSSSIRMWKDPAADFNNEKIINRGFGGSQISDLIENFDRVVAKYNPAKIVLYSGDNDVYAGKSAEVVFGDFCTFYGMVKKAFPETPIIFIAIKPSLARWDKVVKMAKTNNMVHEFALSKDDIEYVDVYSPMLTKRGVPDESLYIKDGLHMTRSGYEIWIEALRPVLNKDE